MLYYLQTNLSAWRAELADAKTLDIRLPMLQNGEQVAFSIPAAVPAGMIRHASVAKTLEGPAARVLQSNLSPISGYIELLLEGVDEAAYFGEFTNHYAVYGADGSELTWAYSVGFLGFDEAGTHLGITITPPAEEWPEKMTLLIVRSRPTPNIKFKLNRNRGGSAQMRGAAFAHSERARQNSRKFFFKNA